MNLDFDPLDVLKQDFQDESVEVQLQAARELPVVAQALGTERTASDLIPALDKYCFPVEVKAASGPEAYSNTDALLAKEEVLTEIAAQLKKNFVEYCGGSHVACNTLLPLLERLCMVEETVIRNSATDSLSDVFDGLETEHCREYGVPIVKRLATDDWFTSKISASRLTPELYRVLTKDDNKCPEAEDILETHKTLCRDEMPMVKNEAYKHIGPFIRYLKDNIVLGTIQPLLLALSQELTEDMRQSLVDLVKILAEKSKTPQFQDTVCENARKCAEDESWRVRKHLVEEFASICSYLSENHVIEHMVPLFVRLLTDTEPQVRKRCIQEISNMLKISDNHAKAHKALAVALTDGTVQSLAEDPNVEVRESLGEQLTSIGRALDAKDVPERLLPVLKKIASDESPVARLNLCNRLRDVADILGIELFENEILQLLSEMTVDQKWRVRNSIVTNIAHIGIAMGKDKFQESRMKEILLSSLKDPAAKVRETAAEQIHLLTDELGFDWMKANIFEPMLKVYDDSGNYLHRMVPLKSIRFMSPVLTPQQIIDTFQPFLLKSLTDPISNVKFCACQTARQVLQRLEPDQRGPIKEQLEKMIKEDSDPDVKFFAQQALDDCK